MFLGGIDLLKKRNRQRPERDMTADLSASGPSGPIGSTSPFLWTGFHGLILSPRQSKIIGARLGPFAKMVLSLPFFR